MTLPRWLLVVPVLGLVALPSAGMCSDLEKTASFDLEGTLSTAFWAYEDTVTHFVSYQQLRVKGVVAAVPGLSFRTNLRWAGDLKNDDTDDANTRLYNALLAWRSGGGRFGLEAGRQFYHMGVGNGTLDGVVVRLRPTSCCRLQAYAGTEVPWTREAEVTSWDDGNVYGLHFSGARGSRRCEFSWVRKSRGGEVYWHQVGGNVRKKFGKTLLARCRLDYNIASSEVQLLRVRGQYTPGKVRLWIEGASQAPRVAEDSYFRIFDLDRFSQVRVGARYAFSQRTAVSTEFVETTYSDESIHRVRVNLSAGMATLGVQIRAADAAGEQTAFFGGLAHAIGPLHGRVGFDVSQYRLSGTDEETDQRALLAELSWKPARTPLSARFQVQRLVNRGNDEDYRGFGRLSLDF